MQTVLFFDRLTYESLRDAKIDFDQISEMNLRQYLSASDCSNLYRFNGEVRFYLAHIIEGLGIDRDKITGDWLSKSDDISDQVLPPSIEALANRPLNAFYTINDTLLLWPMADDDSESELVDDMLSLSVHDANDMLRHSVANILAAMTRVKSLRSVLASKQFGTALSKW